MNGIRIDQIKCLRTKLQQQNLLWQKVLIFSKLVFTTNSNNKGKIKIQKLQKVKSGNINDNEILPLIGINPIVQNQKKLRNILKDFNLQQYSRVIWN